MPASSVPLHRRRWLRWLLILAAAYSLVGFFLVPWIVRRQLVQQAGAQLKRPVAVAQVRVNPWTLSLTIRGLSITDHDRAELAGFDELFVNFSASSLFRGEFHFAEIRVVHPRGRFVVNADGTHNLADLAPPAGSEKPAATKPSRPPAIGVAQLIVERGAFSYIDHSRAGTFETHFGPTSFELRDFTTRPKRTGAYTFAATTESGERFAWQGSLSFEPLASAGRIGVFAIKLPKYAPFHRALVAADVIDGQFTVEADYEVELAAEPIARMRNGTITLEQLAVAGRAANADSAGKRVPFLTVPLLKIEGVTADSVQRSASVGQVLVRGARIAATRRADGVIDVQEWLTPKLPAANSALPAPTANPAGAAAPAVRATTTPTQASAPTPAVAPWAVSLARFEVQDAAVQITDETLARPATFVLDQIALTASGISSALNQPVTFTTSLRWNGRGTLAFDGTARPQPLAADVNVRVADFELAPLESFAAQFAPVAIRGGLARATGKLHAAQATDGALDVNWEGDLGLADFAAVDTQRGESSFTLKDVAAKQLHASLRPLSVSIAELAIVEPVARVVIAADGARPFSPTRPQGEVAGETPAAEKPATQRSAPAPAESASAPSSAPRPEVRLDRLVISGARLSFADASVTPAFAAELSEFGGSIAGLSSEKTARAEVELSGRFGSAPLRVTGQINPLSADAFTDLKVAFTGIELPAFTPYSGKFVGYAIERGKLSLDLRYKLTGRDVVGENDVILDQFFLGEAVESPTAIKLPLKLALAIMRDADGRIVEGLPVRGNLDDPDFRYGRIVLHALRNIILKTATAPFSVLGRLFGGGQDLSGVEFAAGGTELSAETVSRLDALIRALKERPALTLEIVAKPQPRLDEPAVREAKLLAALRARKARVDRAGTTTESSPAATAATGEVPVIPLVLSPEETEAMIVGLYAETFPNLKVALDPAVAAADSSNVTSGSLPPAVRPARVVTRRGGGGNKTNRTVVAASTAAPVAALVDNAPPTAAVTPSATAPAPAAASIASPSPSPAEMRAQLLLTQAVSPEDFAELAARRAAAIQRHLTANSQVDPARVVIAATEAAKSENAPTGDAVRVEFTLK